jgi:hypothetical protein
MGGRQLCLTQSTSIQTKQIFIEFALLQRVFPLVRSWFNYKHWRLVGPFGRLDDLAPSQKIYLVR